MARSIWCMRPRASRPSPTAVRFVIVGGVNTLAGLSVIYALKWLLGVHDIAANFAGYSVGLLLSYVLNARWTFRFSGKLLAAAHRFVLTIIAAYLANLGTVSAAIYVFGMNAYAAQALGIIPYALLTYLSSKLFVFREPVPTMRLGR